MRLDDKIALVTGSSRGIGRGIALTFAEHGARVVITYNRNEQAGLDTTKEILDKGGEGTCRHLDVRDPVSINRLFDEIKEKYGTLDILVNNAAILEQKPCETILPEEWDEMFAVDCRGVFLCSQQAVKIMQPKRFGRIINITSIGGQWGGNLAVHYSAAKAAVISITRSFARIYSAYNITTNALSPGLVETDMSRAETATEAGKWKIEAIPLKRMATIDEISHVALFLASDSASYITGQTINANGGMYFG